MRERELSCLLWVEQPCQALLCQSEPEGSLEKAGDTHPASRKQVSLLTGAWLGESSKSLIPAQELLRPLPGSQEKTRTQTSVGGALSAPLPFPSTVSRGQWGRLSERCGQHVRLFRQLSRHPSALHSSSQPASRWLLNTESLGPMWALCGCR